MEGARADIERLAGMITDARRAVVFTGAGISTESGIPDFRSPTGIWSQATPIYYQEFLASEEARIEAWRRKLLVDRDIAGATPNRGHRAVAKLVRIGKVSSVISQNIDNLHQDSGIPKEKVIELHGNGSYAKCVACETRYGLAPIKEAFERDSVPPACTLCGAPVKTATISFGQGDAGGRDGAREARDACLRPLPRHRLVARRLPCRRVAWARQGIRLHPRHPEPRTH